MAGRKFYAVKQGRIPGVYDSWEECKAQVEGFSGAIYKSFPTREEAEVFAGMEPKGNEEYTAKEFEQEGLAAGPGQAVAYVDGSYNVKTKEYSCGVVFFYHGEEIHIARKGENKELAQMRNVAGEIMGAELAMRRAVECGAETLVIYHDYQGIASWCLGDWKTNREGTKDYKTYYDSIKNKIKISFMKVRGHSGDKWNDLADELAKSVIFQ